MTKEEFQKLDERLQEFKLKIQKINIDTALTFVEIENIRKELKCKQSN